MAKFPRAWTHMRAGLAAGGFAVLAATASSAEPVDVELVLAADVSLSMSFEELKIQRDGYVAALTHQSVIDAIEDGLHGKIALAMFEWAGDGSQYLVVPWTIIASREDTERVAAQISAAPPNSARRTSISGAMQFAADLLAESSHTGNRRVVDISGDGPNNQGPPVAAKRDELTARGIVINGLPLMTNGGLTSSFDIRELDGYYANCVIGGPGSFMVPVTEWSQFPEAIRRKLVLELAGTDSATPTGLPVVTVQAEPEFDCLIGEKRWLNRSWMWDTR